MFQPRHRTDSPSEQFFQIDLRANRVSSVFEGFFGACPFVAPALQGIGHHSKSLTNQPLPESPTMKNFFSFAFAAIVLTGASFAQSNVATQQVSINVAEIAVIAVQGNVSMTINAATAGQGEIEVLGGLRANGDRQPVALLQPMRTRVLASGPVFSWSTLDEYDVYRISVRAASGEIWSAETSDTEIAWPSDGPLEHRVLGPVHDPHAALTQFGFDLIM
jgi:hypothetical protein